MDNEPAHRSTCPQRHRPAVPHRDHLGAVGPDHRLAHAPVVERLVEHLVAFAADAIAVVVSEETGLISFIEGGRLNRNLDTNQLRGLLLNAMDIPVVERKRTPTKTMKESESEITIV